MVPADDPQGRGVLVGGVVPGEDVTVAVWDRPWRVVAQVVALHRAHEARIAPPCPVAAHCAGCSLLHTPPAVWREVAHTTLREVMLRYAEHAPTAIDDVGNLGWGGHRVRASLWWEPHTGQMGLGDLHDQIVHQPRCAANHPDVGTLAAWVVTTLPPTAAMALPAGTRLRVHLHRGVNAASVVLEGPTPTLPSTQLADLAHALVTAADRAPPLLDAAGTPLPVGIGLREEHGTTWLRGGGAPQHAIGGIALTHGDDAWVQPTPDRASHAYDWVEQHAQVDDATVLDATCGTGGLSLRLAQRARHVTGVDANWEAVQSATASAQALGVANVTFRGGRIQTVARRLVEAGQTFDVVLINPMRASLGDACMADLLALRPARIVYLAPAPRAGAADLRCALQAGYALVRTAAIDLHPATGHVMAGWVLQRPGPAAAANAADAETDTGGG